MSYVNLDQLPAVINEYALTRLMPNAPSLMQFVIGGVLGSIQTKIPSLLPNMNNLLKCSTFSMIKIKLMLKE